MGASVGTDSKGSVNVELNVVPFIDLMSCLTAFLLVTAVWSRYAQLDMKPTNQGQSQEEQKEPEQPQPILSVLIKPDQILFGLGARGSVPDWQNLPLEKWEVTAPKVREILKALKADPRLGATNPNSDTIEVGADESSANVNGTDTPVKYQDIISIMDSARMEGFKTLKLLPPRGLTNKPQML